MTAPDLDALVASLHWEWRPGMLARREGRVEARDLDIEPWTYDGDTPDLDDPATCGCLLALVRKAWGPGCRVKVCVYEDGSAYVDIIDNGESEGITFRAESLGLALAAALLAAPPRLTLDSILSLADERVRETGCERPGQALFNVLVEKLPDLAERLRGTDCDPFYVERDGAQWSRALAEIDRHLAAPSKAGEP